VDEEKPVAGVRFWERLEVKFLRATRPKRSRRLIAFVSVIRGTAASSRCLSICAATNGWTLTQSPRRRSRARLAALQCRARAPFEG
jgi:hypothetical protein